MAEGVLAIDARARLLVRRFRFRRVCGHYTGGLSLLDGKGRVAAGSEKTRPDGDALVSRAGAEPGIGDVIVRESAWISLTSLCA